MYYVRPLISAHQGGRRVDGQSAAQRYRDAIALGVDYVEFDVRRTRDGVTVIFHDDGTVSGRAIRGFDYRDLADELGQEALTFDDLLDIAAGHVGLHLDLKETGYEASIVRAMLDRCAIDQFVITSGDAAIHTIKEEFPQVRAGLSVGDDLSRISPWLKPGARLSELFPHRRLERCGADFVAVNEQIAVLTVLSYCKRRGIPAWVWTVDDERAIARFLRDPRVTAVITNRPDIALRLRTLLS